MIKLNSNKAGFSLIQVMVSMGLLGVVMLALIKFNVLSLKNSKQVRVLKEALVAKSFVNEYFSIPHFCGAFLGPLINSSELSQTAITFENVENHLTFKKMDFNLENSPVSIDKIKIQKDDNINSIVLGKTELRKYKINFEITQKVLDTQTKRWLFEQDQEIKFFIKKTSGTNYSLEKCHLSTSKVVTMQKELCEEVGGIYENYGCKFGSPLGVPFENYICEIEKIVVDLERAGVPALCKTGVGPLPSPKTAFNCWDNPGWVLIPPIMQNPQSRTTYCNTVY